MSDEIVTFTKDQQERAAQEAVFQGWAEGVDGKYSLDSGYVRRVSGPYRDSKGQPTDRQWHCLELKLPGLLGPEYWIRTPDEWRRLKAKYEEIKQIIAEAAERGWRMEQKVQKQGRVGMMIEVYPPGYRPPYGVKVGGMRTWRKVCREADGIINASERVIEGGEASPALEA